MTINMKSTMTNGLSAGRGLSQTYLTALRNLQDAPEGEWWRNALLHSDLVIAVRRDSINIYHRGASIFLAELRNGRIVPKTHVKYLVRQHQAYTSLGVDGTSFSPDPESAIWTRYEGPETLAEMIRAAAALAGPEKIGLHALLKNAPHLVDVEIVLDAVSHSVGKAAQHGTPGSPSLRSIADEVSVTEEDGDPADERAEISEAIEAASAAAAPLDDDVSGLSSSPPLPSTAPRQDRLDVATLEEREGGIRLVFHEAKHFANKELRAAPGRTPPVAEQIQRYRQTLAGHADRLVADYGDICHSLVAIDTMRQQVFMDSGRKAGAAELDPLIRRVADGERLQLDPEPRLVIFGFDEDQKNGRIWQSHLGRLRDEFGLTVYAVGNTRTKSSAAFR